jgi:hypothetical protein
MAPGEEAAERESNSVSRRALSVVLVVSLLLAVVYVASAIAYGRGLDKTFTPPTPPVDGLAVSLLPVTVDADSQIAATEVLVFPHRSLLDAEGRLTQSIQLDLYPSATGATLVYQKGTVPSPQKVNVPALGFVQRYPLDSYDYSLQVTSLRESGPVTAAETSPVPMTLDLFFNVPGWKYSGTVERSGDAAAVVEGVISRSAPIMSIAFIFVTLILMFGALAVITVVAGVRRRTDLGIAQAAWLTSATFALIALRNAFPGSPPLGSWIDILVYFWVITAIMLMIGLAVITSLLRQAADR